MVYTSLTHHEMKVVYLTSSYTPNICSFVVIATIGFTSQRVVNFLLAYVQSALA